MYLYWYQWVFVALGIVVAGALVLSVINRASDIYMNKNSHYQDYWAFLLWPVMIPYALIEYPAQAFAKYKEYKSKKKFNKVA